MTGRFLVFIHDATPAYACETRAMIRDLAPWVVVSMLPGDRPDAAP